MKLVLVCLVFSLLLVGFSSQRGAKLSPHAKPSPTPTPTPTTSSVSFDNFSRNLAIGSRGTDVKQLQALLVNEVGYSAICLLAISVQ